MMNTSLFLFGMKLHKQQYNIEFFDADFCNTLLISCDGFTDQPLGDCCELINQALLKTGYDSDLLHVGKLKDIEDFELDKILVRDKYKITIRFNDFTEALKAFKHLDGATVGP